VVAFDKFTHDELLCAAADIEVQGHPESARALMSELVRRVELAHAELKSKSSAVAVLRGATYEELDDSAATRVFWPFFWRTNLLGVMFGFLLGFTGAVGAEVVRHVQVRLGDDPVDAVWIKLLLAIAVAVPCTRFMLRRITTWQYGGYGLRIVATRKSDG
jgi:hypothetical protein